MIKANVFLMIGNYLSVYLNQGAKLTKIVLSL